MMDMKKELLRKLCIDIPEAKQFAEKEMRYIKISFNTLFWCDMKDMDCIFGPYDEIEVFAEQLCSEIKKRYPDDAPDQIGFTLSMIHMANKPNERLSGNFLQFEDGDILHIGWTQRNGKWKHTITGW